MSTEDRQGLAERLAQCLPGLRRHVTRRMGPELRARESASDIVQSTARELLRGASFVERDERALQRWLRAAAEHKIQNRLRYWRTLARGGGRELRGSEAGLAAAAAARPGDEAERREERERVERALARLSPEHRHVVRRLRLEDASYEDVADELGRSPEAVRKLLTRALGRLSTLVLDRPPRA